ncbi:MAG: hypothetical protein O7B35_10565 [Deltaproteobacteria bacterium]|nr:hypothetical protein [Deltaproteobacteria bacterium]
MVLLSFGEGEKLLEVIRSEGFRKAVYLLGGYDALRIGKFLYRRHRSL